LFCFGLLLKEGKIIYVDGVLFWILWVVDGIVFEIVGFFVGVMELGWRLE
jgi:hypothetical protein